MESGAGPVLGPAPFFVRDIICVQRVPRRPDARRQMLVARRYVIRGRVQRVGFRLFVEDAARREAIRGYVRNRHDGDVEIVAEGDIDALQRFEQAARRGPPGARVDEVETTEVAPSGRYATFSVTS